MNRPKHDDPDLERAAQATGDRRIEQLAQANASLREELAERKATEEALRQRDKQLERLLLAALRMNSEQTLDTVLQEVADSARQVIGCKYAALGVLDPSGKGIGTFVASGLTEAEMAKIGPPPVGKGVLGVLLGKTKPIRVANVSSHPLAVGFPPNHPPMTTFLGVPVEGRYGGIGNLYCTEKLGGGEFTAEDENAATFLAAEAAVAVENARLFTHLRDLHASRDRFYAMINHELRNALTAVHGWSELMLRKAGDNPPRPRSVSEVL